MLDISNIVRITVLEAGASLANANTSALALITHSNPVVPNFGDYRVYLSPEGVAKDFGAGSSVAKRANAVFSQSPNITSGGGYLIVIPLLGNADAAPAVINLSSRNLSDLPTELVMSFSVNGETKTIQVFKENALDASTLRNFEASFNKLLNAIGVQADLSGSLASANIRFSTVGVGGNRSLNIIATPNPTVGDLAVLLGAVGQSATGADNGEEQFKEAILRAMEKVYFFGVMFDEIVDERYSESRFKEVAQLMQGLKKLSFTATNIRDRVTDNFQAIADGGFTHTRCLFHGGSPEDALTFMAAYASRAMSVNYNAENSALTMNLKSLSGVDKDDIDQTFYGTLQTAGTDFYANFGVSKVISNGANKFCDDVMNLLALELSIQVDLFNTLGTAPTKIKQTEEGMNFVKSNLRQVLEKFVRAGVLAPGEWNGSETYGNAEKHKASIRQLGYWIYSLPIARQSQADRSKRVAPALQVAVKFAGALHSFDVVLFAEV